MTRVKKTWPLSALAFAAASVALTAPTVGHAQRISLADLERQVRLLETKLADVRSEPIADRDPTTEASLTLTSIRIENLTTGVRTLVITGQSFGPRSGRERVVIGQDTLFQELALLVWSDSSITTTLPDGVTAGNYRVLVANEITPEGGGAAELQVDGMHMEIGRNGPEGAEGPVGPRGELGPIGPEGPPGEQGDPGPEGIRGPVGPRGNRGFDGPQGEPGNRGRAASPLTGRWRLESRTCENGSLCEERMACADDEVLVSGACGDAGEGGGIRVYYSGPHRNNPEEWYCRAYNVNVTSDRVLVYGAFCAELPEDDD